jgi:hypothetical membrane protein
MNYENKRLAGLLFFVGVVQFVLAVVVSEAVYSGYSVGQQVMSDLGDWSLAGNFAAIFDVSVMLLGMFVIVGAYFIQREFKNRLFTSLVVMLGVGCVGVGVVAENIFLPIHLIFALVAFVFGAASAIISYKFEKPPLSYISVILGAVTLSAVVLFNLGYSVDSGFYLGLGLGGMERFIIYPVLLWVLGFGAYLIGNPSDTATTSNT